MNAIPEPVQPASLELVLADYIKAEGVEVAETYKPILAYVSNLALARGTARPSGLQSPVAFAPPCVIKRKFQCTLSIRMTPRIWQ